VHVSALFAKGLIPLMNDKNGDLCSVDNYRGITCIAVSFLQFGF